MRIIEADEVPGWVRKAQHEWEFKLGHRPYDMTKKFYGRNFIYTCDFETVEQGRVCEHWTREKRYRSSIFNRVLKMFGGQIIKTKKKRLIR